MKTLSKSILVLYLLILLWLVLFKFSLHALETFDFQIRGLNLIPFADYSRDSSREMIYNFIVFIPFGLLLGVNLKRATFRQKFACIFFFSLAVEIAQFIFAIGITDITDVATNTTGGLLGLILYDLSHKYVDGSKLDQLATVTVGVLVSLVFTFVLSFQLSHNMHRPAPGDGRHLRIQAAPTPGR